MYVSEAHIMYFVWRCWFINCSEEKGCMGGAGGGVQVHNVTLRTYGGARLFWAQMILSSLVAISGPKKSRFPGSTPPSAPRNGSYLPQNHYVNIKIMKICRKHWSLIWGGTKMVGGGGGHGRVAKGLGGAGPPFKQTVP